MKKKLCMLLCFAIVICSNAAASRIITIQSKEYQVDTLRNVKVGPGTHYTSLLYRSVDGSKYFRGFYLTMDVKGHDNVEYRMELGNDSTLTAETISSVAKRKSDSDTHYFAAVNADFYITWAPYIGMPHMDCFMNGEIAGTGFTNTAGYGHFFMDYNKNMWCDVPQQTFSYLKGDNSRVTLDRINYEINSDELVLFNSKYGKYTKTSSDCSEIAIKLVDGEKWSINKPFKVQVVGEVEAGGNMKIEPNGAVIAAKGNKIAELSTLKPGDVLTMDFSVLLTNYGVSPEIKECSGGDVVILKRGEVEYEASRWINARDNNNPRTMLGYSESREQMIWGLIDGRSTISMGCTYPEGAEAMKYAGCYDAVNVDGGGSAGMYLQNLGIMNIPSDGKERAVSNGIYAVLNAPEDNEIAEIQFVDYAMSFPKYGEYKPQFYGYNKYGLLIDSDLQGVELSCDASLGIVKDKITFIGSGSGTHALIATYNGVETSIPVTIVTPQNVSARMDRIIHDTYRKYAIEVVAQMGETEMPISSAALTWKSDNPAIVEVNSTTGEITGVADGETIVRGTLDNIEVAVTVTVQKPTSSVMAIDPNMDIATWAITQVGGKNISGTPVDNGMELSYEGASGRSPNIKLTKSLALWSLPDMVRIRINPGEAPVKSLTLSMMSGAGKVTNYAIPATIEANKENVIDIPISEFCDANDMISFPITFNSLTLYMNTSTTGTAYKIAMPGMETVYSSLGGVEAVGANKVRKAVIYPNPVNVGENVSIKLNCDAAASVSVFTITGQLISQSSIEPQTEILTLDTAELPKGAYIVETIQNQEKATAILIIK